MESLTFFFLLIVFWIPSIVLLIAGLINYRSKKLRKTLLIASLISFFIPLTILFETKIKQKFKIYRFEGTYVGKDSMSNNITVEIMGNDSFDIRVDNCKEANISGTWTYFSEYDAFLFYAAKTRVSIGNNYRGELVLNCDLVTDCSRLKNIQLFRD